MASGWGTPEFKQGTLLTEMIDTGPSGSTFHASLRGARQTHGWRCVVKLPPMMPVICPTPLLRALRYKGEGRLRAESQNAKAVLKWRKHPGYRHMHPVVHFDARIPMLVSRRAEGTIGDLRSVLEAQSPAQTWLSIAWQLSEAMVFLFDAPQLAHVDIRPKNVLYDSREGAPHCWLSDYGDLCDPDEETDWVRGDDSFKPSPVRATHREHSLFAYYATLVDLFLFRIGGDPETHVTKGGGSVRAFMADGLHSDSDLLGRLMPSTHPLREMVIVPLLGEDLGKLNAHFYDTLRPWLEFSLRASAF